MLSDQFGMTGQLGAGYESDKQEARISQTGYITLTGKGVYAALTPGIVFFPVPKLGLTASIGSLAYTRLNIKEPNQPDTFEHTVSSFAAGFGLSELQFGANFYIGRK